MKRVVIVGGGYAGVTLAKELDGAFDVVLVERKDRFYHNVGAMRAYAGASLFSRLLIPYDRLLQRGRVVFEEIVSIAPGVAKGAGGFSLEADAIVVATGSRHLLPFKNSFRESAAFLAEAEARGAALAAADRVTILGDGPVAVELAGEVNWQYPRKRVQLIGLGQRLLPGAGNPRLGDKLLGLLRERGVSVLFERGAEDAADLVIHAFGGTISVPCLGIEGRVPVDGHFRLPALTGVYAIGDAADCGEPPLSFLARRQARYLARHLRNSGMPPYKPVTRVAMSVPLGPERGATQLPLPGMPVAGSWITSRLKGRDLFIGKNWSLMGYQNGPPV